MKDHLKKALSDPKWKDHYLGKKYELVNRDGSVAQGWRLTYYPLLEENDGHGGVKEYDLPRAIIERYDGKKLDIRTVPFKFIREQEKTD